MKDYRPRIADELLKLNLEAAGLVLIEGTKWCGKTTTAEQQAGSKIYLNDPAKRNSCLIKQFDCEDADLNGFLLKTDHSIPNARHHPHFPSVFSPG